MEGRSLEVKRAGEQPTEAKCKQRYVLSVESDAGNLEKRREKKASSKHANDAFRTYRRDAALPSVPVGMVATFAFDGVASAAGAAVGAIRPKDFLTSSSSFAIVSLLSFMNCRAFSRPWPMRSPL